MWSFDEVVGHKKIVEHLQNGIRNEKVSHAYIFDGDDGAGKCLVARTFAAALQCEEGGIEPCGHCTSCLQMLSANQPDVSFITHEKSIISVDDIREQVCGPIGIKPYSSRYRIFIIDEAEKLNEQAQNCLLKTLEEPPAYGVIILLTNNSNKFLQTILSRAVRLAFLPAGEKEVVDFLMKKHQIPDYRARLAAALSGNNPGKALSYAVSEDFQRQKEQTVSIMRGIRTIEGERLASLAKELAGRKEEIDDMLDLMLIWVRDLLYYKAEGKRAKLMFEEEREAIALEADRLSFEGCQQFIEEIAELRAKKKANVNMEPSIWVMLSHMKGEFL